MIKQLHNDVHIAVTSFVFDTTKVRVWSNQLVLCTAAARQFTAKGF